MKIETAQEIISLLQDSSDPIQYDKFIFQRITESQYVIKYNDRTIRTEDITDSSANIIKRYIDIYELISEIVVEKLHSWKHSKLCQAILPEDVGKHGQSWRADDTGTDQLKWITDNGNSVNITIIDEHYAALHTPDINFSCVPSINDFYSSYADTYPYKVAIILAADYIQQISAETIDLFVLLRTVAEDQFQKIDQLDNSTVSQLINNGFYTYHDILNTNQGSELPYTKTDTENIISIIESELEKNGPLVNHPRISKYKSNRVLKNI